MNMKMIQSMIQILTMIWEENVVELVVKRKDASDFIGLSIEV